MTVRRIGPIYGPLPDLDPIWAYVGEDGETVLYSPDDMLEMIREMQELRSSYDQLHRLSMAMNSLAALSTRSVKTVQDDVQKYYQLMDGVDAELEEIPNLNPNGGDLPIIRADVVEYSEEPLKQRTDGRTYADFVLQPVRERMSRLVIKVCRTLDLEAFDLNEAPCCAGPGGMQSYIRGGTVPLYRS